VGYKIREHTLQRVPYLLVVGDREMANGRGCRARFDGADLGSMAQSEFAARLASEAHPG